ncbi:MAG: DNA primase DnaG [Sulfolobales archaeon]|nr:DNA primase DnaG [Sulfolobales archaeon]MCX8198648.1 DNA primase DnaG [Sulfolobales archaeon]
MEVAKYLVKAKVHVDGIVEKPDVIGAIFGQTEGLFGGQLDLRELQESGRIGRIQVNLRTHGNTCSGEIIIPSNLDRVETALVAALIESVDKVGPYNAKVEVSEIVDLRLEKIRKIVDRAKEILLNWSKEEVPDVRELLIEVETVLRKPEPIKYGSEGLAAGPDIEKASELIIVEGRADVINLLRYGYTNAVEIGGARAEIPKSVKDLAERKEKVIAFLDGDRAGDMILKELLKNNVKIDYIARAPPGREVEELSGKEINEALSKATSLEKVVKEQRKQVQVVERAKALEELIEESREVLAMPISIIETAKSLNGTLEAVLLDAQWNHVEKLPVRDLVTKLQELNEGSINAIVFDGIITQRLLDVALEKNIKIIVGVKLGNIVNKPREITILTYSDLH